MAINFNLSQSFDTGEDAYNAGFDFYIYDPSSFKSISVEVGGGVSYDECNLRPQGQTFTTSEGYAYAPHEFVSDKEGGRVDFTRSNEWRLYLSIDEYSYGTVEYEDDIDFNSKGNDLISVTNGWGGFPTNETERSSRMNNFVTVSAQELVDPPSTPQNVTANQL